MTDTPIGLRLTSSIAVGAEEFTPLTMSAPSVPVSFAWDSGDDDLPGPN